MNSAMVKLWVAILLVAVVAYGVRTAMRMRQTDDSTGARAKEVVELNPELRPLEKLANVELVERSGANFRWSELEGKIWVANIFYAACPKECKLLLFRVKTLQDLYPDVRFVSITCDPDRDTPEKLREHAALYQADPRRWYFLTGEMPQIQQASKVLSGFVIKREEHSQYITLVDHRGRFVNLYHGLEGGSFAELMQAIEGLRAVANEQAPRAPEPA